MISIATVPSAASGDFALYFMVKKSFRYRPALEHYKHEGVLFHILCRVRKLFNLTTRNNLITVIHGKTQ